MSVTQTLILIPHTVQNGKPTGISVNARDLISQKALSDDCYICQKKFQSDYVVSSCGHGLHSECFETNVQYYLAHQCPICKQKPTAFFKFRKHIHLTEIFPIYTMAPPTTCPVCGKNTDMSREEPQCGICYNYIHKSCISFKKGVNYNPFSEKFLICHTCYSSRFHINAAKEPKVTCIHCSKQLSKKSLRNHINKAHRELQKTYNCPVCKGKFATKSLATKCHLKCLSTRIDQLQQSTSDQQSPTTNLARRLNDVSFVSPPQRGAGGQQ
jgi:hypothetical protein